MEKLQKFLKAFIFVQPGIFLINALMQYIDYVKHPDVYMTWSAPWYTEIQITAIITAITVTITVIAYIAIGKLIEKRKKDK